MLCSEAMMMKTRIVAIVVLVMLLGALQREPHAQDNFPGKLPPIQITGAGQLYPVAVSPLKDLGGDSTHTVSGVFDKTLTRDLQLSSFFRIIDSQAYIEDPQTSGYDIGQFNFADWRSINAEFLVKGAVTRQAGQVTLEALLFDVGEQRRLMGKPLTRQPAEGRD